MYHIILHSNYLVVLSLVTLLLNDTFYNNFSFYTLLKQNLILSCPFASILSLISSRESVTTETIQKCFKACGFDTVCDEECVSVPEETENEVEELTERLGEINVHYVQDCIGEYAIPRAESLIVNLVAEYIDEGDEEDDSALDKNGILAAVSDVSNKVLIT